MKKFITNNQKGIVGTIFLILFDSTLYLCSKLIQGPPNLLISNIDNKIPFVHMFVYIYAILYILLFLVPLVLYTKNKEKYYQYFVSSILAVIISNIIFIIYPTTVIRPTIPYNNITNYILNIIYQIDTPAINCFPSLHCLISFLFIYYINTSNINNKIKLTISILSILVVLSTILIKQHILIDVISAFILSIIIFIIVAKTNIALKTKKIIEKQ